MFKNEQAVLTEYVVGNFSMTHLFFLCPSFDARPRCRSLYYQVTKALKPVNQAASYKHIPIWELLLYLACLAGYRAV